jgi:hypothetical protein
MDENVSDLKIQFVPRSKNSASVIKTDKLMLFVCFVFLALQPIMVVFFTAR